MTTVTKMRLSKETFNILKNFATINSNVLIKPGNKIRTVSIGKNIYAEATVQEDFETEIAIWDLNKFLGIVSMFSNPDLEFYDTHVDISNGKSTVTYYYSEPSLLTYPSKQIKMPDVSISFILEDQDLNEIMKAASILQVSDVIVQATANDKLEIIVNDISNNTSNHFSIVVDEKYTGPDFKGSFKVSEIKFLPGSYKVDLTDTFISKFTHQTLDISYYISIHKD
jgi:hypothetical protein